jgi:hypothetical protein
MENATEDQPLSQDEPAKHSAGGWQLLWFLLHLTAVYVIVKFCTPWLAGWTRGTLLPLLQHPTSSGSFEFFFSHILAFSFIPAFSFGVINARWKYRPAQFVWLVPAVILAYKFATFPAESVLQSQFSAAWHQYFAGGFLIPEFKDWSDFWSIVGSNADMTRGMAQLNFTAPFYAAVGYSAGAWTGHRTNLTGRANKIFKDWEQSRFDRQSTES